MKHVTFLNRCYWPDAEATGQLLTQLCEFLAADREQPSTNPRWDVSVVVGQPNWDTGEADFARAGSQQRNGVRITRLRHSTFPKRRRWGRLVNLASFTWAVRAWARGLPRLAEGVQESSCTAAPSPGAGDTGAQNREREALSDAETSTLPTGESFKDGDGRRRAPDVIVCETDPFFLPLVAAPTARRSGARLVFYLQDIYPDVAVAVGAAREGSFVVRQLRRRLRNAYAQADAIVVLDADMRDRLVGWGLPAEKFRIVPNWMDCDAVRPVKQSNPFRHRHGLDDRFVVMHSGNMGLTQRLEVLVDAMHDPVVPAAVSLALVGNGARRSQLERLADGAANVRFFDYQPIAQLGESLSAADLHVVSMDAQITGCLAPSKLYGILASGTPVLAIVPRNSAVWRLVEEHRIGWTVEPGHPAAVAAKIAAAAATAAEEREAMGQRARTLAVEKYDRQLCCAAFENVLKEVVGSPKRGSGSR